MSDARKDGDARFDEYVAAVEDVGFSLRRPGPKFLGTLWEEHKHLVEAGLLDPDEPTPYSFYRERQLMTREFTPVERMMIRTHLGLDSDA